MANLTITGYTDETFGSKAPAPSEYVAMLNPESIERGRSVEYSDDDSGTSAGAPKFNKMGGETLSFELVIDCTGVVDASRVDLKAELEKLSAVVYDYKGSIHRPNYVTVSWGNTLSFNGVLSGMSISYTFFKPDGSALRAKVKLDFKSYVDAATQSKAQNNSSPDVTHRVLVKEGDSLPLIAARIYRSPDYFVALAQANGLDGFRRLTAGTVLSAPPLKAAGGIND